MVSCLADLDKHNLVESMSTGFLVSSLVKARGLMEESSLLVRLAPALMVSRFGGWCRLEGLRQEPVEREPLLAQRLASQGRPPPAMALAD